MNINDKLTQDLAKTVEQVIENKEENIEEAFMRLPSTVIGSDLYSLQKDLSAFMYSQMKNRDFNPKQFDDHIEIHKESSFRLKHHQDQELIILWGKVTGKPPAEMWSGNKNI